MSKYYDKHSMIYFFRSPVHKKKLQEILDLLKKWAKAKPAAQPKPPIPLCQNETSNLSESENKKPLTGLPKVGVSIMLSYFFKLRNDFNNFICC